MAAPFRDKLLRGQVALPDDPLLLEELRTYAAFTNARGLLQCIGKDDHKKLLSGGRSPDRMDAVLMAVAGVETHWDLASRPVAVVELG